MKARTVSFSFYCYMFVFVKLQSIKTLRGINTVVRHFINLKHLNFKWSFDFWTLDYPETKQNSCFYYNLTSSHVTMVHLFLLCLSVRARPHTCVCFCAEPNLAEPGFWHAPRPSGHFSVLFCGEDLGRTEGTVPVPDWMEGQLGRAQIHRTAGQQLFKHECFSSMISRLLKPAVHALNMHRIEKWRYFD